MKHISELFPVVMVSSEPAKQELNEPKTGPLVKAIKEKRLFELSDQGELEQCLRYCMVLVGLRANNFPGKEETAVMFAHIMKYYAGHTVAEIRLAFEMAVSGQLDIDEKDVKAYENFSTIYFSQIINSYRRWAAQEYKQSIKSIEPPPPQRIFTQEELDDGAREDVERQYQMFLKRIELKAVEFNRSILQKDNLLNEDESTMEFFIRKAEAGFLNIYTK